MSRITDNRTRAEVTTLIHTYLGGASASNLDSRFSRLPGGDEIVTLTLPEVVALLSEAFQNGQAQA